METPKGEEPPKATESNLATIQENNRPGLGGDDAPASEMDDSAQMSVEQKPIAELNKQETGPEISSPTIVTPQEPPTVPVEESKATANVEESKLPPIGSGRSGVPAGMGAMTPGGEGSEEYAR